ncbi:hypothetical protein HK096_004183 [Nowakowskiella sp. JEL0078]|nr:hypothetical protein HK096_004183 [Nowakowskiella sp. JEL0078]
MNSPPPPYSPNPYTQIVQPMASVNQTQIVNRLKIKLSLETSHINDSSTVEKLMNIKLIPPENSTVRTPVDICVVIDISGSMGAEAKIGNEDSEGLTVLDIVKHSTNVIIITLTEKDRLSIVSFSSVARIELEMTTMNELGRARALDVVKTLEPENSTNLWGGLYLGLETFRKVYGESGNVDARIGSVFLLTDGMPNITPPRGHLTMLKEYKDNFNDMPIINTFGFGYSLDSNLLYDLAKIGEGQYSFIPDSSFVGTVFIHATTTLLTTFARSVKVSIEATLATNLVVGGFISFKTTPNIIQVEIGSVLYGQTRDLVVKLSKFNESKKFSAYVWVEALVSGFGTYKIFEKNFKSNKNLDLEILSQYYRLEASGKILEIVANIAKGSFRSSYSGELRMKVTTEALQRHSNDLQEILNKIENASSWKSKGESKKRMIELSKDLDGQVKEAFESETAYKKWGQHYLPSLAQAHQLQICNNFKDPGVQLYIGKLGISLRLQFDSMFLTLPPPIPSNQRSNYRRSNSAVSRSAPDMTKYHDRNNPCFAGHCRITKADGSIIRVDEVRKGDHLLVNPYTHQSAIVKCVVETVLLNSYTELVGFNDLLISPFHPVFVDNKWIFPVNLERAVLKECDCDAVYTFVLESVLEESKEHLHTVVVEGVRCATLGHNLIGDVIEHEYFGTQRVILDLKKNWEEGWANGWVCVQGTVKGENGLACAFLPVH